MFAQLKKWQVLQGGSSREIEMKEKELDTAMALHNLNLRVDLKLLGSIRAPPKHAAGSHIITSDEPPSTGIPWSVKPSDAKFPAHLKRFMSALPSLGPTLRKIVLGIPPCDFFTPRGQKRGENLFVGGSVLQIVVEEEPLGVWRTCFVVGASRKHWVYRCYARLNKDMGVLTAMCECKAG